MYPIMLNLARQEVTLIGGGEVAYRKAEMLVRCGGKVRAVAPSFDKRFEGLGEGVWLTYEKVTQENVEAVIATSQLVIAATDDKQLNAAVGNYCEKKHIWCNIVDNKALSSVMMPATIKKGSLVLTVSTGGKSPLLAKRIKAELEAKYRDYDDRYLDRIGTIRDNIVQSVDNVDEKKRLLEHLLTCTEEELARYETSDYTR